MRFSKIRQGMHEVLLNSTGRHKVLLNLTGRHYHFLRHGDPPLSNHPPILILHVTDCCYLVVAAASSIFLSCRCVSSSASGLSYLVMSDAIHSSSLAWSWGEGSLTSGLDPAVFLDLSDLLASSLFLVSIIDETWKRGVRRNVNNCF